jgi:hypothetical protein
MHRERDDPDATCAASPQGLRRSKSVVERLGNYSVLDRLSHYGYSFRFYAFIAAELCSF